MKCEHGILITVIGYFYFLKSVIRAYDPSFTHLFFYISKHFLWFLTYFYTLYIYELILLSFYVLEMTEDWSKRCYFIRDSYCVKFLKTLTYEWELHFKCWLNLYVINFTLHIYTTFGNSWKRLNYSTSYLLSLENDLFWLFVSLSQLKKLWEQGICIYSLTFFSANFNITVAISLK